MRRIILLAAIALAGCSANKPALQGYVEGTYVYVSAETAGRLATLPVTTGGRVAAGDVLFALDDSDETQAVAGANARLAQAEAQLADLKTGKRDAEIAVLAAALSAARATFSSADDNYTRQLVLREKGVVAQSEVDSAKTARDAAEAQVESAQRQLEVGQLPARPDEIAAAELNVSAEQAALAQAQIQLDRRQMKAPAAGLVEETYYEPGELVAAGQAVVSLLPDANRKVRFFVPEQQLASVAVGSEIGVGCDGCRSGLTAKVEFVATEAEFTPPIIYSKDSRDKLVFRVDARPIGDALSLKVGQPLDIHLAGPAP